MKNQFLSITLVFLGVFLINGCSTDNTIIGENSIKKSSIINLKSEAEKLVDLHCKAINILRKVDKGDRTALNRSNALRKEADKISNDLKKKYASPEEQEEFSKAYQAALINCPYNH